MIFAMLASAVLVPVLLGQSPIVPDMAVMDLDEIGLYEVGYAYRGQAEQQFPLGWSGSSEEHTGVSCLPLGSQDGRRAFLLHCPWRGGTGIAFQQFTFSMPLAPRIVVRGATALRSDVIGKSDGATFRVFAGGRKLLDVLRATDAWEDFEFDLTEFAGTDVTIRFETDPGPRDNSSYDHSLWGARELRLEGFTPTPPTGTAPPPLALSNLWQAAAGEIAPPSGFPGTTSAQAASDVIRFRYEGSDGVLEYRWDRPQTATDPLLGTLLLTATMAGQAPVVVPLASSSTCSWTSTASPVRSFWRQTQDGFKLVREYTIGATSARLEAAGRMVGKSLVLSVTCNVPLVQSFDAGAWGPVLRRRAVTVPYYSGAVYFLTQENLFVNAILDWTASAASSHDQLKAYYQPLTSGGRSALSERVVFTAAWHLAEVFPSIPNAPSPYRGFLADKIVLDIWGGRYDAIAANLERFVEYGIAHCVALIHVWQRSGYDNALPMHVPANADLGGDPAMIDLVATGNRLGIPVALHENYVDYYPNYDFFDGNDIALDSSGNRILAWYNPGTEIQSFAVKPNAILRLAATQSPEIHRRYGTQADYLDVHSAVPPWFHVDFRAGEEGAGTFARVWDVHRELWDYERATHGGPVFGEGANHWYWSGCLDGVEAQFGWSPAGGASAYQGMTAPLSVDFDLLKIHPLQLNHGMGYYERWWAQGYESTIAGPPPMVVLDQYRMQEVAFGHAGFCGHAAYASLPLVWLEHHLLSPVTARYATARPAEIAYEVGGAWVDATAAAKAEGAPAIDRVRVSYENGLVVTANSRSAPLAAGSWTLPRFGWLAHGPGITAGTVLLDGVVADSADTGDSLFVNARAAGDWYLSSFRRIRPAVASYLQTAARTFRATYRWEVDERLPIDYRCFVHFTQDGTIRWQQDHAVTPPTSQWQPGQTITDGPYTISVPASIPDGDYDWLIGLFDLATGARVKLRGVDDGTARIRLGALQVRNGGTSIAFVAETGTGSDPSELYREHLNESGRAIDFGSVRTDGSIALRREGPEWRLISWPRERSFTLEFDPDRFPRPAAIQCIGGPVAEIVPMPSGSRWRLPLNGSREYRWAAGELFRRGDANGDGEANIGDPISILSHLFGSSSKVRCEDAADANDDGSLDIADPIKLLAYLFAAAAPLPPPFDACGTDPSGDELSCSDYPAPCD